jgi:ribosomal-protein-alanine N-acetyltransferase
MVKRKAVRGKPQTLTTDRLQLVAPNRRHAAGLFAYGSRQEFTVFLDSAPFRSKRSAEHFLQALEVDNRSGKRLYWVAELGRDKCAVGTLGFLFPFSPRHRVAEFGYGFSPETWGTGLFTEAATAVIQFGFAKLGLSRIQVTTRAANVRSVKAVEKIGFRREATLAAFYQDNDGDRSDAAVLALLAPAKLRR